MFDMWSDEDRKAYPRWRSWGDGPLVVARPPAPTRMGNGRPYPHDKLWGIYHRKTGRLVPTALVSKSRTDHLALAHALQLSLQPTFWKAWRNSKPGDPFEVPPAVMDTARRNANMPWVRTCLDRVGVIQGDLQEVEKALAKLSPDVFDQEFHGTLNRLHMRVQALLHDVQCYER